MVRMAGNDIIICSISAQPTKLQCKDSRFTESQSTMPSSHRRHQGVTSTSFRLKKTLLFRVFHWSVLLHSSSMQPFMRWPSSPNAPCACISSYSSSRKSRELLLGKPRMVNLCETLVHCSRFAATRSYSSVDCGRISCSSLSKREDVTGSNSLNLLEPLGGVQWDSGQHHFFSVC